MLQRLAFSIMVHLAFAVAGIGLIWVLTNDDAAILPMLLAKMFSDPAGLASIRAEAAGHMMQWCALALLTSFVTSSLWVVIAERTLVMDTDGARSRGGSWAGLLILALILAAASGYAQVYAKAANLTLTPQTIVAGGLVTILAVVAAYYLGTFVAVKRPMRPSIPLAPHV